MNSQPAPQTGEVTEASLLQHLNRYVHGHTVAKRKLAAAWSWNQRRWRYIRAGIAADTLPPKVNCLLVGNTGQGKSLIVRTTADHCRVPFFTTSATGYTSAGFQGLNVEDMVTGLFMAAKGNHELASRGLIFIDEIDKLRRRNLSCGDVGAEAVQQALLAIVEGSSVLVGPEPNRKAAGHRRDHVHRRGRLCRHGTGPRRQSSSSRQGANQVWPDPGTCRSVPGAGTTHGPSASDFRALLVECDSSPLKRLQNLYRIEGLELKADERWLDEVVAHALQMDTGVRGLNEIVLDRCLELISGIDDQKKSGQKTTLLHGGQENKEVTPPPVKRPCRKPTSVDPPPPPSPPKTPATESGPNTTTADGETAVAPAVETPVNVWSNREAVMGLLRNRRVITVLVAALVGIAACTLVRNHGSSRLEYLEAKPEVRSPEKQNRRQPVIPELAEPAP